MAGDGADHRRHLTQRAAQELGGAARLHQHPRGLGSAHARGILHRDLKPDNVLFAGQNDVRGGLRLVDFGLAFLDEGQDDADERKAAGTPRYMAPEQLLSHWRDFGPWTDLYALGCLAWQLCTGETPFQSMRDFRQLLRAHLHMAPPAFKPIFKVPKSFEVWLRTLLAKRRTDRFPFAADALSALPAIDAGDQQARLVNLGPDDETEILDKTVPDLPSAASLDLKTEKTLLSDQTAPSIEIERVPGGWSHRRAVSSTSSAPYLRCPMSGCAPETSRLDFK